MGRRSIPFPDFMRRMESCYIQLSGHRAAFVHDDNRPCRRCVRLMTSRSDRIRYLDKIFKIDPDSDWQDVDDMKLRTPDQLDKYWADYWADDD